ncbi:SGNH/GDSL hydrolase family protein [Limosilactobacillus sp. STM2_1]|uniref:SGNH/GDSL hydrolase family protein n=1 Tax=Limosilactobacillus rudii TaxID=2759755 RepID=A0A7W3UKQ2_9LACO|nr:SGNH/GDSL hydrolase family protein [Limosilactobacillus rudii]MBB1079362.1 SGNH/GDSL hydrolase family protein [Limosilactobacillus rudii]MBB1097408.1 SGNH/GDSL hydrolase family protein [Limosilactobacillus rudii]MCD7134517.1 SGNH/GDSL hydrolase family protein [Limosilactobacillus rudii]
MKQYLPNELITFATRTGRWRIKEINNSATLYTTNLGSYLRFQTNETTQLNIHMLVNHNFLSPSHVLAIRIDNHPWHRYPVSNKSIQVSLTPSSHIVEIMAAGNADTDQVWTSNEGFAITEIDVDKGNLKKATKRPLINFIGDSITAGCWVAGNTPSFDYRPEANYAAVCADILGVDSVRIAYSAGGVLRLATGGVPTADKFLSHIDATTDWLPNSPDLVVINLGVNDRHFPTSQFIAAYDLFIQQVQLTFANTPIAIMIPFSQTFAPEIRQIAKERGCYLIETDGWCQSFTDGLHPDQNGATTSGHKLAKVLRTLLPQSSVQ